MGIRGWGHEGLRSPEFNVPDLLEICRRAQNGPTMDQEAFDLDVVFATARRLCQQYGIAYERDVAPDSALGYTISHPASVQLIDDEGVLVGSVLDEEGLQTLRARVLELLGGGL